MSLVAWWNRQRSLLCYPSEGKNFTCCLIRNYGHLCDPTPYRGICSCLCRGVLSDPIVVRGKPNLIMYFDESYWDGGLKRE